MLTNGELGLRPENAKLFHRRAYHSPERAGDIIFDVVIEVNLRNSEHPSLLWIWECKDYSSAVPVKIIEEFGSKLNQIGAHNTKGTVVTSGVFQTGAFNLAQSQKIGLVRLMPEDQVEWIIPRSTDALHRPLSIISETEQALTSPGYRAQNQEWFAFTGGGATQRLSGLSSFVKLQLSEWELL